MTVKLGTDFNVFYHLRGEVMVRCLTVTDTATPESARKVAIKNIPAGAVITKVKVRRAPGSRM